MRSSTEMEGDKPLSVRAEKLEQVKQVKSLWNRPFIFVPDEPFRNRYLNTEGLNTEEFLAAMGGSFVVIQEREELHYSSSLAVLTRILLSPVRSLVHQHI